MEDNSKSNGNIPAFYSLAKDGEDQHISFPKMMESIINWGMTATAHEDNGILEYILPLDLLAEMFPPEAPGAGEEAAEYEAPELIRPPIEPANNANERQREAHKAAGDRYKDIKSAINMCHKGLINCMDEYTYNLLAEPRFALARRDCRWILTELHDRYGRMTTGTIEALKSQLSSQLSASSDIKKVDNQYLN